MSTLSRFWSTTKAAAVLAAGSGADKTDSATQTIGQNKPNANSFAEVGALKAALSHEQELRQKAEKQLAESASKANRANANRDDHKEAIDDVLDQMILTSPSQMDVLSAENTKLLEENMRLHIRVDEFKEIMALTEKVVQGKIQESIAQERAKLQERAEQAQRAVDDMQFALLYGDTQKDKRIAELERLAHPNVQADQESSREDQDMRHRIAELEARLKAAESERTQLLEKNTKLEMHKQDAIAAWILEDGDDNINVC